MKICTLICEFNPLHNGHKYILDKARKLSGCDYLVAVMGGNFCQRADPAFINEYVRAEIALACSADMVIELPAIYAAAAADKFAFGAVEIIKTLPNVTHLVMGSECNDPKLLDKIGKIQAQESEIYSATLKAMLNCGKSYAKAVTEASAAAAKAENLDGGKVRKLLNLPNNILAVAYKKMLELSNSAIEFLPVPRIKEYLSASDIRANFSHEKVKTAMPEASYIATSKTLKESFVRENEFDAIMLHSLRKTDENLIAQTPDCNEGLEYKIKKAAVTARDYKEMLSICSCARYTTGRIKRICVQNLLGIKRGMQESNYNCARLLGIRKSARELLSILPNNIITNKASEKNIPTDFSEIYNIDKAACGIYSVITHESGNGFYKKLIKV